MDVLTINASGLDAEKLTEAGIKDYYLLIACTGSDEINTVICKLAKKLGCKKTIARIRNPEYMEQLDFFKQDMGIDRIVNPDLATANEITRYLSKRYNFYSDDFAEGEVQMIDFCINNTQHFLGKRIMDLEDMEGLIIAAILRNGVIMIPNGATILQQDDVLYIIGKSRNIDQMADNLKLNVMNKITRKVMIFGGGNLGYYLAKQLSALNLNVTIVEQDGDRCRYLSDKLNNVIVIHGDGTDINLLEEEHLRSMDVFIGATGYDEQNLLMSLMAKQSGVKKIIAKISRPSYVHLIDKLGIDFAINPTNVTSSDILKFIRGGKVVSVSLLLGGQAEVIEVIVDKNLPFTGKKIADMGLSKGIIFGAVVHEGQVIIPNGKTVVDENDRVIIFCLTTDIAKLEMFLKPSKGGIFDELRKRNKGFRNPT